MTGRMSDREVVVLGTASQIPTRERAHNACLLRWDDEAILFDPGEGTQRQLAFADLSPVAPTRVCITHFHGDHCLGLPGIIQRFSLERMERPLRLWYPASGQAYLDRLEHASIYHDGANLEKHPVTDTREAGDVVDPGPPFELRALPLEHRVDAIGFALREPDRRHLLTDRLEALGIRGPAVGELRDRGSLEVDGRVVHVEEVSEPRRGQRFAFVMDTRLCDTAFELAERADLLVCEATFLSEDEDLARESGHLTAAQAARLASEAGARRLVITHFSARHPDTSAYLAEAREVFPDVVAATDLVRVEVPHRS